MNLSSEQFLKQTHTHESVAQKTAAKKDNELTLAGTHERAHANSSLY